MDDKTRLEVEAFARKNHHQFGRGFTMLNNNRGKSDLLYFLPGALDYSEDGLFDGDFIRSQIEIYDMEQTYLLVITNRISRNGMDGTDSEALKMAFSDRVMAA